ncbi:MAG: MarR family winged helix-turn-helix transcriptional regulator [Nanoarchaeota archaeon]
MTANDISKKMNLAISQVSFTLKELLNMQLIECLNPNDKIGKLYKINTKGKELLNEVGV